jgi:hypothetical protein
MSGPKICQAEQHSAALGFPDCIKRKQNMKKLFLAVLVLFVVVGLGFAQTAGTVSAGAKLGGVAGFHGWHSDIKTYLGKEPDSNFNFTFGAFGAYTIIDNLSIQVELDFMLNQGGTVKAFGLVDVDIEYNSLDIPVLIKYAFLQEPLIVGVAAGPQLSIPIGDIKISGAGMSEDVESDGITFGAVAGVYAGYPLGPGSITGDIRFLFDFSELKGKDAAGSAGILTRRGLVFTLGYEFSF